MPKDPKYVRLVEHLNTSVIADIQGGSGWSISGNEVKEFPKRPPEAQRFVRQRLVQGILEPASAAELKEQTTRSAAYEDSIRGMTTHQEEAIIEAAEKARDEGDSPTDSSSTEEDDDGGDGSET